MSSKLVSIIGILAAISCVGVATSKYPGGFKWNQHFLSTLLREPAGPARLPAVMGLVIFCLSLAVAFNRLANAVEFSKHSRLIRIGGIGSMVYGSLTFTPMHDLMVTLSLIFFVFAVLSLIELLYKGRETVLFATGCVCLSILVASATSYYTGLYSTVLPWAQRLSFGLFTVWVMVLDHVFPRNHKSNCQESS